MTRIVHKMRFAAAYPLVGFLFIVARTSEATLWAGTLFIVSGELIRFWANGCIGGTKVNRTRRDLEQAPIGSLVTAGPYAFVRHPLYLGTFLIFVGISVIVAHGSAVLAVIAFLWIYDRKMKEEEELLRDECGSDYADYFKSVPRWIPNGTRYSRRNGNWNWWGISQSKEWKTVLWLGVLILAFYFREEWLQQREFFKPEDRLKQLSLLCLMALLAGIDLTHKVRSRVLNPAH